MSQHLRPIVNQEEHTTPTSVKFSVLLSQPCYGRALSLVTQVLCQLAAPLTRLAAPVSPALGPGNLAARPASIQTHMNTHTHTNINTHTHPHVHTHTHESPNPCATLRLTAAKCHVNALLAMHVCLCLPHTWLASCDASTLCLLPDGDSSLTPPFAS